MVLVAKEFQDIEVPKLSKAWHEIILGTLVIRMDHLKQFLQLLTAVTARPQSSIGIEILDDALVTIPEPRLSARVVCGREVKLEEFHSASVARRCPMVSIVCSRAWQAM